MQSSRSCKVLIFFLIGRILLNISVNEVCPPKFFFFSLEKRTPGESLIEFLLSRCFLDKRVFSACSDCMQTTKQYYSKSK